jgi:hypothetical protein
MNRLSALAVLLVLTACVSPSGEPVDECNTSWRGLEARIVGRPSGDAQPIPIACMWQVDEKRISIGFELPPGPDCYELASIEQEESAGAVAVTVFVSRMDDVGGSCSPEPIRSVTEIDLQSPVGDRRLLDGSR